MNLRRFMYTLFGRGISSGTADVPQPPKQTVRAVEDVPPLPEENYEYWYLEHYADGHMPGDCAWCADE